MLASDAIENEIKDLAGCRIIFYTNTDLERFRQSENWRREFDIDWSASKTHFPRSAEDATAEELYQGIHYVARLTEQRTRLPEYADLVGMRCEIQLQTILNHAWSEASHDILDKARAVEGFGGRQHDEIRKRFSRVMITYLMPAGYEFLKIQDDAERLKTGRELFDAEPLVILRGVPDNNVRLDTILRIKEHMLPGLDDRIAHAADLREVIVGAIEAARNAPVVPREAPFGTFAGATALEVSRAGLEALDELRYTDPHAALTALFRLWCSADQADERERVEESVECLAGYSIPIWQQVGAGVQWDVLDTLHRLGPNGRRNIRPLVLKIVRTCLATEMRGVAQTNHETVTFSRGTVVLDNVLREVRSRAVAFAIEALDEAAARPQWRAAWNAVWSGGGFASPGNALRQSQIALIQQLARYIAYHKGRVPYENLQEIEEQFYWAPPP